MAKEGQLIDLLDNYLSGSRLDYAEAIYMWIRDVPAECASSALRIRYGNGSVFNEAVRDLKKLKIGKPSDRAEDTKIGVNKIIRDFFEEKFLPLILERMMEGLKIVMSRTKKLIIALARSGLLRGGNSVDLETLWILYKAVFNEDLTEFERNVAVRELIKINMVEYVTDGRVHFPPYVDAVGREFKELASLPKVEIPDLKDDKEWWKAGRERLLREPLL